MPIIIIEGSIAPDKSNLVLDYIALLERLCRNPARVQLR